MEGTDLQLSGPDQDSSEDSSDFFTDSEESEQSIQSPSLHETQESLTTTLKQQLAEFNATRERLLARKRKRK